MFYLIFIIEPTSAFPRHHGEEIRSSGDACTTIIAHVEPPCLSHFAGNASLSRPTLSNAIEYLNSVIPKSTKKRKVFPTDNSATKIVYLAIQEASKKWTMPIRNWKPALNRFMIEFKDRLIDYI